MRRWLLVAVLALLGVGGAGALASWLLGRGTPGETAGSPPASSRPATTTTASTQPGPKPKPRPKPPRGPVTLTERTTGTLTSAVQDAAVASGGQRILLLGGLNANDASTDTIRLAGLRSDRELGRLPRALHDSAALVLAGTAYLFGGGDASAQHDEILRIGLRTGRVTLAGRLPAPSSDHAAAALGGTAYVVGGFTGARWLDTIVAWKPGGPARIVAHLPVTLRYTAVAAAAEKLVIAGGSLEQGRASAAVFEFDPKRRRVTRIGTLPAPTTHAAAAALGGVVYVVGGRGDARDSQTRRIVAIDVAKRKLRPAGTLDAPRSDLAAAPLRKGLLLAGGRGPEGTEATLSELVPAPARAAQQSTWLAPRTPAGDVYAFTARGLAPAARSALPRVYVPNSESNTVDVIDPRTFKVVEHFAVGALPQHVTPAYDLRTLYVTNDVGNSLTPIDPRTGKPGRPIPVDDPYNLYFTPDGRYAIVVAERLRRLDFRDAHTFRLHRSLPVPCAGVDHMDFTEDGRFLLASCEFSGQLVVVDVAAEKVVRTLQLPDGRRGMPQDVKLAPAGQLFYVADMAANGLWKIDARRFKVAGFVPTGKGVHGLYPSRDARFLYATNRAEGSISVLSFRTQKVVVKWRIPGGGSPDMGGVSADGKVLWLSGRWSGVVYAISTRNGKLLARIPVGSGPHGLCVWPQPGRYSLGHTGLLR